MRISENTSVSMPMRNLLSIVVAVAIGVWAYFGVIERLNNVETQQTLMEKDLDSAVEFSIKWPRGDLGSLPADSEQFMLIEHMAGQIEKIQEAIEEGMHNKVNIDFLKEQMTKIQADVEKLKDGLRQANGNHK